MITNAIVFSSVAFIVLFFIAWLVRPDLRAWIEKPKFRFQRNVQSYDQAQRSLRRAHSTAPRTNASRTRRELFRR